MTEDNKKIIHEQGLEALARSVDLNAIECGLYWGGWDKVEAVRWEPQGDSPGEPQDDSPSEPYSWIRSLLPYPYFNVLLGASLEDGSEVTALLDELKGYGRSFYWWVGPTSTPKNIEEYLLKGGLTHRFGVTGMAHRIEGSYESEGRGGRENGSSAAEPFIVEEVLDGETLRGWNEVMCTVFGFPEEVFAPWYDMHRALGLSSTCPYRHYVAKAGGRVVGTASLFLGAGVAGLSNISTLPEFRGLGIGSALTLRPLSDAGKLGYSYGVLMATSEGVHLYRRLGFKEVSKGGCYYLEID